MSDPSASTMPVDYLYLYRGIVTRVVDGDTVEILCDLGMYIKRTIRVRIDGYDAPELFRGTTEERAAGQVWKERLEALVLNQAVLLRTEKDKKSFDRYIAAIWRADGLFVAEAMRDEQ